MTLKCNKDYFYIDQNKSTLEKQASLFITLIVEAYLNNHSDLKCIIPSVHALQKCLTTGWIPNSYPLELIQASIHLLDYNDKDSSIIATEFLMFSLELNKTTIAKEIINVLLDLMKKDKFKFSNNQFILIDKVICIFIQNCFDNMQMKATTLALSEVSIRSDNTHFDIKSLKLGDALEIYDSLAWISGIIVRINSISGELHIEHRANSLDTSQLIVSIVHKDSSKLRLIRSNSKSTIYPITITQSNEQQMNLLRRRGLGTTTDESVDQVIPPPPPQTDTKDNTIINTSNSISLIHKTKADISLLILGSNTFSNNNYDNDKNQESDLIDIQPPWSNNNRNSDMNNTVQHVPHCEHGHVCKIAPISLHSIGFMCANCTKLYSLGSNLPTFGRQFPELAHLVQLRYAQATHKWSCEECHYDVCLICYPYCNPSKDVNNITSHDYYNIKMKTQVNNHIQYNKDDLIRLYYGTGQRISICLSGKYETSYCLVRETSSELGKEVGRVSLNSVIDVIDCINSNYYQLISEKGYVKKYLGYGCYWRNLPRDRYMMYGESSESDREYSLVDNPNNNHINIHDHIDNNQLEIINSKMLLRSVNISENNDFKLLESKNTISYLLAMILESIMNLDQSKLSLYELSLQHPNVNMIEEYNLQYNALQSNVLLTSSSLLQYYIDLLQQTIPPFTEIINNRNENFDDIFDDCFLSINIDILEISINIIKNKFSKSFLINQNFIEDHQSNPYYFLQYFPINLLHLYNNHYKEIPYSLITSYERFSLLLFFQLLNIICENLAIFIEYNVEEDIKKKQSNSTNTNNNYNSTTNNNTNINKNNNNYNTQNVELCYKLIGIISKSEFATILIPFYFRVMILKAGIRVKIAVQLFLNSKHLVRLLDSTEYALNAFQALSIIENIYQKVIFNNNITITNDIFYDQMQTKFKSIIHKNGYYVLSNGIIQQNHRLTALNNIHEENFKKSLKLYILQPTNKFSKNSKNMRKLLHEICHYATQENIAILEGLWREIITEVVIDKFNSFSANTIVDIIPPSPFHENSSNNNITSSNNIASSNNNNTIKNNSNSSDVMIRVIENRYDKLVDELIILLRDIRYISRMDMAVTKQCCMSADMAFLMAFQRLPKDKSLEFTKALVVRISSLIDAFKPYSTTTVWMRTIDEVVDFIQVFFNQTSAEFQHFYELLLARRLLRDRFISLPTERKILAVLPAMSKSHLMIRDLEQTYNYMGLFRNYLIHRIDFMNVELPPSLLKLALCKDDLNIHILTADIWPSFFIAPTLYSKLKLPLGLQVIKNEFIRYFELQNTTRYDNNSSNMSGNHHKDNTFISVDVEKTQVMYNIIGSDENKSRINGIYIPTEEISDGWPIYEMLENTSSILEYSMKSSSWQIKKRADKGKNAGWAYCKASSIHSPEMTEKPWYVWKKSIRSWVIQAIKVTCLPFHNYNNNNNNNNIENHFVNNNMLINNEKKSTNALKSLIWCHAAGTMLMQATLNNHSFAYLLTTEAQATILWVFNNQISFLDTSKADNNNNNNNVSKLTTNEVIISFSQLQSILNLTSNELGTLLTTLISSKMPILERINKKHYINNDFSPNDLFQLSKCFLDGNLGISSETNPFILSSIEFEQAHSDAQIFASTGINSIYGWRNELIDASIVRVLKDTYIQKTGEFRNVSLSIDTLCYRVRKTLRDKCDVSSEDIMKRSERLVSIGVIEKVIGNPETFRSVAYSYLTESVEDLNILQQSNNLINETCYQSEQLSGEDLYNHLRMILQIKTLPYNVPGISKSIFISKFITWIIDSKCDTYNLKLNVFDMIARLLFTFLNDVILQVNALKLQFWHGIHSGSINNFWLIDMFTSFKNGLQHIEQFQLLSQDSRNYSNNKTNYEPILNAYFSLNKIYFMHLPVLLIQTMLNCFRELCKDSQVHYDDMECNINYLDIHNKTSDDYYQSNYDQETYASNYNNNNNNNNNNQKYPKKINLIDEVDIMWNRTAVIHKDILLFKFGFTDLFLMKLNIIPTSSTISTIEKEDIDEKYTNMNAEEKNESKILFDNSFRSKSNTFDDKYATTSSSIKYNIFNNNNKINNNNNKSSNTNNSNNDNNNNNNNKSSNTNNSNNDNNNDDNNHNNNNNNNSNNDNNNDDDIKTGVRFNNLSKRYDSDDIIDPRNELSQQELQYIQNYINEDPSWQYSLDKQHSLESVLTNKSNSSINNNSSSNNNSNKEMKYQLKQQAPLLSSPTKKNDKNMFIKITFQQLISAIFYMASEEVLANLAISDKKKDYDAYSKRGNLSGELSDHITFGYLLNDIFFKRFTNIIAEIFNIDLYYGDDDNNNHSEHDKATTESQELANEDVIPESQEDEPYIPCEFCTDSIRASLFATHTIACRLGRPIEDLGNNAIDNNPPTLLMIDEPGIDEKDILKSKRPNANSIVGVSLVKSLLDNIVSYCSMYEEESYENKSCTLTSFLEKAFDLLDRDKDGYLSVADFSTTDLSYADLRDTVDPNILYGHNYSSSISETFIDLNKRYTSKSDLFSQTSQCQKNDTIMIHDHNEMNEDDSILTTNDLILISTPIPLHKTDSLWRSVSHESSLPKAEASRSFSGLEEAEYELNSLVFRAMSIIDDSEATALSLLIHYRWDLKSLVEEYIENSRSVRYAVGLSPRNRPPFLRYDMFSNTNKIHSIPSRLLLPTETKSSFIKGYISCGICQETVKDIEAFALGCHHWFCADCWQGYLQNAISDRLVSYYCPQPSCRMIITQDMQNFFCSKEKINEARIILIKSFIEDRRGKQVLATYCKNPRGCAGIVLLADDADHSEASCSLCSTTFCAACDMPSHAPATCEMVAKWEEKGGYIETGKAEDVEARKLKHLTTKPCPKCGVRIEKNGGCPHMTCVQPSCKYQFCWECSGEYHTSSTCSRPKIKIESNSILIFDELDRQCANHFLARKISLKGKLESIRLLEQIQRNEDAIVLRVISEGWNILAESQSALAHSCITMLNIKSIKLNFLFECHKILTQTLQQKFEEIWTSIIDFPLNEAKAAIRDLRLRLKGYLLMIQTEIINEQKLLPKHNVIKNQNLKTNSLNLNLFMNKSNDYLKNEVKNELNIDDESIVCNSFLKNYLLEYQQQHNNNNNNNNNSNNKLDLSYIADVIGNSIFGDAFGTSWKIYSIQNSFQNINHNSPSNYCKDLLNNSYESMQENHHYKDYEDDSSSDSYNDSDGTNEYIVNNDDIMNDKNKRVRK